MCRRVVPDYAADLSIQILDRETQKKGRLATRPCNCTVYMCQPNLIYKTTLIWAHIVLWIYYSNSKERLCQKKSKKCLLI